MCQTTDYNHLLNTPQLHAYAYNNNNNKSEYDRPVHKSLLQRDKKDYLRLTNFTTSLSISSTSSSYLPEFLTLVFLPRINGGRLDINGSKARHDSPAFLTLHRTLSSFDNVVVYSTNDRLTLSDGAAFEVHVGDVRLLKGVFREQVDEDGVTWRCDVEERVFNGVKGVEVCVGDKKVLVVKRRWRNKGFKMSLEEIPEAREDVLDDDDDVDEDIVDGEDDEVDIDGLRWTIDVGIWVACFGLGLLVSRASVRSLWRRKLQL